MCRITCDLGSQLLLAFHPRVRSGQISATEDLLSKKSSPCRTLQSEGMAEPTSTQRRYFKATAPVALPPLLLLTVMVPGFVATLKRPRNRPLPSPVSVPIFAFVDVTKMVRVALAFVLVA